MTWPGLALRSLLAAALASVGCGGDPQSADFVIRFDDESIRTDSTIVHVEITRGGCGDGLEVVYQADVSVSGTTPAMQPPELAKGTYGFSAEARDGSCEIVAAECTPFELPRDDGRVLLTLIAGTGGGSACDATEMCVSGRCRPTIPQDGGPDDGGPLPCDVEDSACGEGAGICHGGACCVGCWTGSACVGGGTALECGLGGEACVSCSPGDPCAGGVCANGADSTQFYLTPVGSFLRLGDGTLFSAGDDTSSQRGMPRDETMPLTFSQYTGPLLFADIAAGQFAACGITRDDGHLYCWGRNVLGALGLGTSADMTQAEPQRVQQFGDEVWNDLSGGDGHFCAIRDDGGLYCWGDNRRGQLGLGMSSTSASMPTQVAVGTTWSKVADGVGYHVCAIRTDGTLWCWGNNENGQLAQPMTMVSSNAPVRVGDASDWVAVAAGVAHSCGVRSDGTLWCWGNNSAGQLGVGDLDGREQPTQVGTQTDWRAVAAGEDHSCGLLRVSGDISAFCWGLGVWGELGRGTGVTDGSFTPVPVSLSGMWSQVATGWAHSCGVRGGSYHCWGQGREGQIGNGTMAAVNPAPAEVTLTPTP